MSLSVLSASLQRRSGGFSVDLPTKVVSDGPSELRHRCADVGNVSDVVFERRAGGVPVQTETMLESGGTEAATSAGARQSTRPLLVVPEEVNHWFNERTKPSAVPPSHVREWLAQVVTANYRLLYLIAYGFFSEPGTAEDMVQNAVLTGLKHLDSLREPEAVLGWLTKITRNCCLQVLRTRRVSESLENVEHVAVSNDAHAFDEKRLLLAAINKLPEKLASVVQLRFLKDCNIADIALLLALRRNTVEVRLYRALHQLAADPELQVLRRKGR